jgi:hypothetical protein
VFVLLDLLEADTAGVCDILLRQAQQPAASTQTLSQHNVDTDGHIFTHAQGFG